MGRSREPLVFTCFGGMSVETKCCEGVGTRAKAAPLQALGDHTRNDATTSFEDDDEYENDLIPALQIRPVQNDFPGLA